MNTQQIATRLAQLCAEGQFEPALVELFAEDAVSIEPDESPDFARQTKGLPALIAKGRKFHAMLDAVHGCSVSAPIVAGNSFALTLALDVTMKGRGRTTMQEVCVYQTKDGKVVSEQFFF